LKANGTMFARVLIVIPKTIHILVSPLTIADATCEGSQTSLRFTFYLAKLALCYLHPRSVVAVDDDALLRQEGLQRLQILWWREVARAMGHVVLEPIGLLVRLVAIRLRAAEGFGEEEGRGRTRKCSAGARSGGG